MDGSLATGTRPPLAGFTQKLLNELTDIFVNRGASYSDFDDNSKVCQDICRSFGLDADVGIDDTTLNGVEMIRHKLSRLASNGWNHRDSWLDLAGYALLIAAAQDRAKQMAYGQVVDTIVRTSESNLFVGLPSTFPSHAPGRS